MDIDSSQTFEAGVRKIKSTTENSQSILNKIVAMHLQLLPSTSSSMAGPQVVELLYKVLSQDSAGVILFGKHKAQRPSAFASGTTNLRATEIVIRKNLELWPLLKLLFFSLLKPTHLLARWTWEHTIPKEHIGYILTFGAKPSKEIENGVRGHEILKVLEHEFLLRDCREVWVDTEASNVKALEFYIKYNYVLVDRAFGHNLLRKSI